MTRSLSFFIVLVFLSYPASPAKLRKSLESKWLGAWVITKVEIFSDCDQRYTDNDVNGRLVSGKAAVRFTAGELAKVEKITLGRSQVNVFLDVEESFLQPFQDGPFTLYHEVHCQAKLLVNLPRQELKDGDPESIETYLKEIFESYPLSAEARDSETWNRRRRDPYPDDYEQTLANHQKWKIQTRIGESMTEAGKAIASVRQDEGFSRGLTAGIASMRQLFLLGKSCEEVLTSSAGDYLQEPPLTYGRSFYEGARVGQYLTYHLELVRVLRGCIQ